MRHVPGKEVKDVETYFDDNIENSDPIYSFKTTAQTAFL